MSPAGTVLSSIASQLLEVVTTLECTIQNNDVTLAAAALAQVRLAGSLADEAAQALGQMGLCSDDDWLRPGLVGEALRELQRPAS